MFKNILRRTFESREATSYFNCQTPHNAPLQQSCACMRKSEEAISGRGIGDIVCIVRLVALLSPAKHKIRIETPAQSRVWRGDTKPSAERYAHFQQTSRNVDRGRTPVMTEALQCGRGLS